MIFTNCVTEPAVTKTVSKKTVSAENATPASLLVIKEVFRQENVVRATRKIKISLFIHPPIKKDIGTPLQHGSRAQPRYPAYKRLTPSYCIWRQRSFQNPVFRPPRSAVRSG